MWQIALVLLIVISLTLIPKKEIDPIEIFDDDEEELDEIEEWAIIDDEEEEEY